MVWHKIFQKLMKFNEISQQQTILNDTLFQLKVNWSTSVFLKCLSVKEFLTKRRETMWACNIKLFTAVIYGFGKFLNKSCHPFCMAWVKVNLSTGAFYNVCRPNSFRPKDMEPSGPDGVMKHDVTTVFFYSPRARFRHLDR